LVKKIKKLSTKTRTMVISGYEIEPGELQIDINKGIIDRIIQKPISMNSLRQEVKNQINAGKSQDQSDNSDYSFN
jgi:response regulator RpfG family c-di-GMP phosphodiesterase